MSEIVLLNDLGTHRINTSTIAQVYYASVASGRCTHCIS